MKNKTLDVICLGRACVDLYGEQIGSRLEDMRSLKKYIGGSSANMAVGMSRLGLKTAMLTRVGDEHMGRFVTEELALNGVDTHQVISDTDRLTGLVLLGIKDRNTFPLIFYRDNCADMALCENDINEKFIASSKALVISGTHFSAESVNKASRKAVEFARKNGTRTVLDIDYRPVLWGVAGHGEGERRFVSSDAVSKHLRSILSLFDLIVGTEEEVHIAGGTTDTLAALENIRELSAATIVLKRGSLGCAVFEGDIPSSIEEGVSTEGVTIEVLNVLGAGDAFISGFMRGWVKEEPLENCCRYANACGALVVSRHGCAPAIPSSIELDDYLARATEVRRPDLDKRLQYLHRVTVPKRQWPDIYALAFDHRIQLETMAKKHGSDIDKISALKKLIAKALHRVIEEEGLEGHAGLLVDGRFGEQVLEAETGKGLWLGRPVELPQSRPLQFEMGNNISAELASWPTEHIVKCLVFYHPDDTELMRSQQDQKLRDLYDACLHSGNELLLEVILPDDMPAQDDDLVRAMNAIYQLGIYPEWWKLPPPTVHQWPAINASIESNDPHCHGVILLGLNQTEAVLAKGFNAAASETRCKGFAIGRSIFIEPAEDWFARRADDEQTIMRIAEKFTSIVKAWRKYRTV
jgi:5-dehydro-2-deoxygluconokinase